MLDIGFFIWKLSSMPVDPMDLVKLCNKYGIKRLSIKLLNKYYKFNVPNGDKPLMEYIKVLTDNGIIVEGWGYHYPDEPGPQGDAVEERRQKLGITTYHIDVEREWKQPFGMPAAAKTFLSKLKVFNFETLFCSYRYPSKHAPVPFDAFMLHETVDGATPQVYWALAHNPAEQLDACFLEYYPWKKAVYPVGATFGASFKVDEKWVYWEPTVAELVEFREYCKASGINRIYYYSLDWVLSHKRFDLMEAATGFVDSTPPPEPPPEKDYYTVVNCKFLNGRMEPIPLGDNILVIVRAGEQVKNLHVDNGEWRYVGLDKIKAWMHGDYLG